MSTTTTTTTTTAPQTTAYTLSSQPASISTTLNYFTPPKDGARPYTTITPDPSSGELQKNWEPAAYPVEITNLRALKGPTPSLDVQGFTYVKHESKEKAFVDSEEALKGYYDETVELIKRVTGAKKAVIFDHTIRRRRTEPTPDTPSTRQPVPLVHVDQTPASARARVFRHVPEEAEELVNHRFQILNIWRPIGHAAYDMPLALGDGRTIAPENLIPTALVYPDREGETYSVAYSDAYKWFYLRGMTPSEAFFIKCFDSEPVEGGAKLTPHTAFADPTTPEGVKPRESIEIRALVFY